jgi:hypothetical protein
MKLAMPHDKPEGMALVRETLLIQHQITSIEIALRDYPLDEIYMFKQCCWSFDKDRLKKAVNTVKNDFRKRDDNELEEDREKRLDGAVCFLFGWFLMKGKATEAILVLLAGELGLGFVFGLLLGAGAFDKNNNNEYDNKTNN